MASSPSGTARQRSPSAGRGPRRSAVSWPKPSFPRSSGRRTTAAWLTSWQPARGRCSTASSRCRPCAATAASSPPKSASHPSAWVNSTCSPPSSAMLPSANGPRRSEEHTSELQSLAYLVCRLLLEKTKHHGVVPAFLEAEVLQHDHGIAGRELVKEIREARFFFNDTATTEIYTLSLHDALPISSAQGCTIAISGTPDEVAELGDFIRSEEHTSELQSLAYLACRLLLDKKNRSVACHPSAAWPARSHVSARVRHRG